MCYLGLAGQVSVYGFAAYSASKGGLRYFAEALQQELLPFNIRLSVVYPPDTDTPGFEEGNAIHNRSLPAEFGLLQLRSFQQSGPELHEDRSITGGAAER